MFIATHKKIANSVYGLFSPQLKSLISKKAFIEGSHYPDTNFKYTIISHSYECTIDIVKEKMNQILSEKQKKKSLGKKLGIICHFIADYCSPYHVNEKYKNHNIIPHLNYERKTNINTDIILLTDNEIKNNLFININTLAEDLKSFIDNYMQGDKNMKREVKLAVLNSYHIVNLIMEEYIKIHIDKENIIELLQEKKVPASAYYPPSGIAAASLYENTEYFDVN